MMKTKFKILISVGILIIVVLITTTLFLGLPSLTGDSIKKIKVDDVDFTKDCIQISNNTYRCFLGKMKVKSGDTSLEDYDVTMTKDKDKDS